MNHFHATAGQVSPGLDALHALCDAQLPPLGNCPRTLCLFKAGQHLAGVDHKYSARAPGSAVSSCIYCGASA